MTRKLMFSLSKDDFEFQYFRAGGKGGQKQNKTSSGCRVIHRESGAVGEGRDERSQPQNRRNAFERMVKSDKFQAWLRKKTAEAFMGMTTEEAVDRQMVKQNLLIEVKNENGQWIDAANTELGEVK